MGQYQTDIDGLGQFLKVLQSATEDLDRARTALNRIGGNSLGTDELDDACDDFQDSWGYGAKKIREGIEAVSEGVKANKQAYEAVEEAVAASFAPSEGEAQ
ncbi:hypothetical protein GTY65_36490 [Streptomyces sp. SID8379]|uniref:hypothetical protein n=1 Tax=unclassified Streptomyces TaxID=2593676 RepID=UPI0003755093|nr:MULTISPECIES: hypothetical protein [unclassified Streptomyces]MYW69526.1 hypothetical protein [Streptomyces sp. SID8379]